MAGMRACILSVAGPELRVPERALLGELQPWGVILMGRSCVSRPQVRSLVDSIWQALGRACLIFIDQEGGRVARLKPPEWPVFPPAARYGALYLADPGRGLEACWLGHRLMAAELSALGIHADCAPVCDLLLPGRHQIVGDRAFGTEPAMVAELARAALRGLGDGGVAGVVKHLPGHGRARVDSHLELPRVTESEAELSLDMAAFAGVRDAPMGMTAHLAYDSLHAGVPATLSPRVIGEVIRTRIGFDGLLMSDDLGMNALGGSLATRTRGALAAGCDVVLHCAGFVKEPDVILGEMREVAEAAPTLAGRPLERARAAEAAATHAREDFDTPTGWARFHALMDAPGGLA